MFCMSIVLKAKEFSELTDENITGISNGSNFRIVLPPEILGMQITQPGLFYALHLVTLFTSSVTPIVRIGSIIFRNLSSLLPPRDSNSRIVTPVISSTTNCKLCATKNLQQNVTVQLQVPVSTYMYMLMICMIVLFSIQ